MHTVLGHELAQGDPGCGHQWVPDANGLLDNGRTEIRSLPRSEIAWGLRFDKPTFYLPTCCHCLTNSLLINLKDTNSRHNLPNPGS